MKRRTLLGALLLATLGSSATALGGVGSRTASEPAQPKPSDFVARVDNPWFPLKPGAILKYRGIKDGQRAFEVFTVTRKTKRIQAIATTVVHDALYLNGRLREETNDWYAQDRHGTVWYFGEATGTLDRQGHVTSREGSFQAGRDGARAGIYMPARPRVGRAFQQEYFKGHAEDHFRVLSLQASVRVPGASSAAALRTKEWTPLEPGVVDNKYYVRGIGTVKEASVKGADEHLELVSVARAPQARG